MRTQSERPERPEQHFIETPMYSLYRGVYRKWRSTCSEVFRNGRMGRKMDAVTPHEVMTNLYKTTDVMTKDQGIANAGDKGTQASAAYTPGAHTHRPSSSSGARDRRPCFTGRGPNARTRRGYGTPIIAGRECQQNVNADLARGRRGGASIENFTDGCPPLAHVLPRRRPGRFQPVFRWR